MRIITLERVAGVGNGNGYIYAGNGHLLRFCIESPEHFFEKQLPFVVDTLNIDVRQIMRLELLSDEDSGLSHVMLYISFEDSSSELENPETLISNLWAAPSTPPRYASELRRDDVGERLIEFFRSAPPSVKSRFLKKFENAVQNKEAKRGEGRPSQFASFRTARMLAAISSTRFRPSSMVGT